MQARERVKTHSFHTSDRETQLWQTLEAEILHCAAKAEKVGTSLALVLSFCGPSHVIREKMTWQPEQHATHGLQQQTQVAAVNGAPTRATSFGGDMRTEQGQCGNTRFSAQQQERPHLRAFKARILLRAFAAPLEPQRHAHCAMVRNDLDAKAGTTFKKKNLASDMLETRSFMILVFDRNEGQKEPLKWKYELAGDTTVQNSELLRSSRCGTEKQKKISENTTRAPSKAPTRTLKGVHVLPVAVHFFLDACCHSRDRFVVLWGAGRDHF